jgi:preprotein translocase subunit SecA
MRKQLLEYDDVANDQRRVIYQQRNELLESQDISETVTAMREDMLRNLIVLHVPSQSVEEEWDIPGLEKALTAEYQLALPLREWLDKESDLHEENLHSRITEAAQEHYRAKVDQVGAGIMHQYERAVMLQSLDTHWREHLSALDHLRQGIHLRGYAQKNPKQEYKREAFELFTTMLEEIKSEVTRTLMTVQIRSEQQVEAVAETQHQPVNVQYRHAAYEEVLGEEEQQEASEAQERSDKHQPFVRHGQKIGRNDPCPCGSGKKYKQCHGKLS